VSEDPWFWIWLAGFSLVSLFFAANTFALREFSRSKLEQLLEGRGKGQIAANLQTHLDDVFLVCSTLRSGANLVLVLSVAWMIVSAAADGAVYVWHFALAFVLAILLVFVVSVAVPKAWARYGGEHLLTYSLPVLFSVRKAFWPLVGVMRLVDVVVKRLAGVHEDEAADNHFEQEIMEAVQEGEEEGLVDQQERRMIEAVMEFRDVTVEEIMTPRTEIVGVEIHATLEQIKQTIAEHGHSRLPVYEESLDNIEGMLYAKDLLRFVGQGTEQFSIQQLMRQCYFVPESKSLRDLFAELRQKKVHLAIVLDEYGGTSGLVTIEDVIEQIVGQITDEYEPPEPAAVQQIDAKTLEVDARTRIDELNEQLDLHLPEGEDYETLGGFLFHNMGRIPTVGETFTYENKLLTVLQATPRRIDRVKLEILSPTDGEKKQPDEPSQIAG